MLHKEPCITIIYIYIMNIYIYIYDRSAQSFTPMQISVYFLINQPKLDCIYHIFRLILNQMELHFWLKIKSQKIGNIWVDLTRIECEILRVSMCV